MAKKTVEAARCLNLSASDFSYSIVHGMENAEGCGYSIVWVGQTTSYGIYRGLIDFPAATGMPDYYILDDLYLDLKICKYGYSDFYVQFRDITGEGLTGFGGLCADNMNKYSDCILGSLITQVYVGDLPEQLEYVKVSLPLTFNYLAAHRIGVVISTDVDGIPPTQNEILKANIASGTGYGCLIIEYTAFGTSPIVIETLPCTDRTLTTCTANGNIIAAEVNADRRGFCYKQGTTEDPTTADSVKYEDGDFGVGEYSLGLTGLVSGEPYRVRAYAVRDQMTFYGDTVDLDRAFSSVSVISSIRRMYRPGLYRIETASGDLGFEVEVSEAAMKRVSDEVKEPEEPEEPEEPTEKPTEEPWKPTSPELATIIQIQQADLMKAMFPKLPTWATRTTSPASFPIPTAVNPFANVGWGDLLNEYKLLHSKTTRTAAETQRMNLVFAEISRRYLGK